MISLMTSLNYLIRNGGGHLRSTAHHISYSPTTDAMLICSVSICPAYMLLCMYTSNLAFMLFIACRSAHSVCMVDFNYVTCISASGSCLFFLCVHTVQHLFCFYFSCAAQNTTNPETAFYELFSIPKETDPSNPECKSHPVLHTACEICLLQLQKARGHLVKLQSGCLVIGLQFWIRPTRFVSSVFC